MRGLKRNNVGVHTLFLFVDCALGVSLESIVETGEEYLEFDARLRGSLEKSDNVGHPFICNT